VRARGGGAKGDLPVTVFHLHLNGGPRDDEVVSLDLSASNPVMEIPGKRPMSAAFQLADPTRLWTKVGSYAPRRNAFDQFVPHNLQGVVEADWQGWRE
jgi:hypothetical protein